MYSRPIRQVIFYLVSAFALISFVACAPRTYMIVDYPVPAATNLLQGQKVRLQIQDARTDTLLFTPAAAQQFEYFRERYSLSWVDANKQRVFAGDKDLPGLFYEVIKKRLEQLGAQVVAADEDTAPSMVVSIRKLKVDLRDYKWVANAAYEATLSHNNNVAREAVSGEAERVRIIGRKGADNTLSDIFGEMINRLNILKLFQNAKAM
ncbi:MAG: hypothetical protein VR64_12500 [Desulfatitalea sp. BRH_c12]|nr:MAG: hypothetical protein VR64_12500 [Desulfatitalea sp. BRH_c12]